jgi:hypothetical protein
MANVQAALKRELTADEQANLSSVKQRLWKVDSVSKGRDQRGRNRLKEDLLAAAAVLSLNTALLPITFTAK